MSTNPYELAGFYDSAIAAGRHRAIVGGRWDETGRIEMSILQDAGLLPHHHLLDIGAGALRLGCKAVPYLEPGHYWATDASREILLAGHRAELEDPARLDPAQLIEDARFDFPGVPESITHAIAFAVFPHLPTAYLRRALTNLRRFDKLESFLFTVFLAPDPVTAMQPYRQPDGVVTHDIRAPYHILAEDVVHLAQGSGWTVTRSNVMLPRGQVLFTAHPIRG
ncbi:class I SAM-dependent methyltransferase [Yangia mangrovi]|uniref:Class I SAM-dependent methyltransferase n=1 Tax=Alloyangia mangrovi TaxID=1779329 RepID=A0A2A3JYJ1_9RHOB|nr:class I SAM-dependent methyltransferase [Alloyangia mangrovi]MCT4370671.1 class I SAM-dependent methyltransferase [Alloyangia mangrovi]